MEQSHLTAHSQGQGAAAPKHCVDVKPEQVSLWTRQYSNSPPLDACPSVDTDLNAMNVAHAHQTPSRSTPRLCKKSCVTSSPRNSKDFMSFDECWTDFWRDKLAEKEIFDSLATLQPPISASSLRELEIACIMNNVRLRHDINFDKELHFRPNLDGERGREKNQKSEAYWKALETELRIYNYLLSDPAASTFRWTEAWLNRFRQSQRRIPAMFEAVKDILFRLMPEQDQDTLKETLDVSLIMQQIERGLFDLSKLAIWFAQLLKLHCAPMRDPWVDQMVEKTSNGAATMDSAVIVSGLKELFGILEAMKLDVANHQIRYLRPMLLESTIAFEQNYYTNKIENKQFDPTNALAWYERTHGHELSTATNVGQHITIRDYIIPFATSLVTSVFSHDRSNLASILPETFKLDLDRLRVLSMEVHGLTYHLICYEALEHIIRSLGSSQESSDFARANVGDIVRSIIGFSSFSDARGTPKHSNVALELIRLASGGATMSSHDFANRLEQDANLIETYGKTETWLQHNLQPASELFAQKTRLLQEDISDRVINHMDEHSGCSAMSAFEALSSISKSRLTGPSLYELIIQDVARRLAHIGILHWQVWAPLVYAKDSSDLALPHQNK